MTTTESGATATETTPVQVNWATKDEQTAGHRHVIGAKCDMCGDGSPVWQFAGGATSFEDVDRYMAAAAVQGAVESEMSVFDAVLSNIRSSELEPREKAAAIARLANELDTRLATAASEAEAEGRRESATTDDPGMMSVFKDLAGNWRWLAIHSNKYVDREGEIFPESAHKAFVEQCNARKSFPALRLWHVPTDIGRADMMDYDSNGFVVSSGTFNPGWEGAAERLSEMKGLGCSHGFLYRPSEFRDGVYKSYTTYEVSVLPVERAANSLTAFFAGEEIPMLTPERKSFLAEVAGPERAEELEQGVARLAEIAQKSGLTYKALEESLIESRKDEGDPAPAPTPGAPVQPAAAAAEGDEKKPEDEPKADEQTTPPAGDVPTPTVQEQADAAAAQAAAQPVAEQKEIVDAVKAAFAPITDALAGVQATLVQHAAQLAALTQTKDAALADTIRPRVGPIANGVAASASEANVVNPPVGAVKEETMQSGVKAASPYVSDAIAIIRGGLGAAAPQ